MHLTDAIYLITALQPPHLSLSYLLHQIHTSVLHNISLSPTTPYSHHPPSAKSHVQQPSLPLIFDFTQRCGIAESPLLFDFTQRCDTAESCCSATWQYHSKFDLHIAPTFCEEWPPFTALKWSFIQLKIYILEAAVEQILLYGSKFYSKG